MTMNVLDVARHLFQSALTRGFGLPVSVNFTLKEGFMDVTMMRQSTLDEFMQEYESTSEPLWTDVIVNLSPRILADPTTLIEVYHSVYGEIESAISRGRIWVASDL